MRKKTRRRRWHITPIGDADSELLRCPGCGEEIAREIICTIDGKRKPLELTCPVCGFSTKGEK